MWSALFRPDAQLVNLTGNTNLPGLNSASNLGWGYMTRTQPEVERHDPAHSSFDLIADFGMPVIGSLGVGAAAGLGMAAANAGATLTRLRGNA